MATRKPNTSRKPKSTLIIEHKVSEETVVVAEEEVEAVVVEVAEAVTEDTNAQALLLVLAEVSRNRVAMIDLTIYFHCPAVVFRPIKSIFYP